MREVVIEDAELSSGELASRSPTALAELANHHDSLTRRYQAEALMHAKLAGDALLAAKEKVEHGQFGRYLDDHFMGSVRTARIYMRISHHWSEILAAIGPQIEEQPYCSPSIRQALLAITDEREEEDGEEVEEPKRQHAAVLGGDEDDEDRPEDAIVEAELVEAQTPDGPDDLMEEEEDCEDGEEVEEPKRQHAAVLGDSYIPYHVTYDVNHEWTFGDAKRLCSDAIELALEKCPKSQSHALLCAVADMVGDIEAQ